MLSTLGLTACLLAACLAAGRADSTGAACVWLAGDSAADGTCLPADLDIGNLPDYLALVATVDECVGLQVRSGDSFGGCRTTSPQCKDVSFPDLPGAAFCFPTSFTATTASVFAPLSEAFSACADTTPAPPSCLDVRTEYYTFMGCPTCGAVEQELLEGVDECGGVAATQATCGETSITTTGGIDSPIVIAGSGDGPVSVAVPPLPGFAPVVVPPLPGIPPVSVPPLPGVPPVSVQGVADGPGDGNVVTSTTTITVNGEPVAAGPIGAGDDITFTGDGVVIEPSGADKPSDSGGTIIIGGPPSDGLPPTPAADPPSPEATTRELGFGVTDGDVDAPDGADMPAPGDALDAGDALTPSDEVGSAPLTADVDDGADETDTGDVGGAQVDDGADAGADADAPAALIGVDTLANGVAGGVSARALLLAAGVAAALAALM